MQKNIVSLIMACTLLYASSAFSENKFSVDMTVDKLQYQKPPKGIGKAGILIFKSANVNNNGIILNINNVNNYFDSQIFVRPTFLGFTTQFGNYGVSLEANGILSSVNQAELQNSKLILDDTQLNLSGEYASFINTDSSMKLKTFRLYCQSILLSDNGLKNSATDVPTSDIMSNCFSFLTLNGNYAPGNAAADFQYESLDKVTKDKTYLEASVKSFDVRKTQINANLLSVKTVSNDSYIISASNVNLICAKDENLKELDFNLFKKTCLNQLKLAPVKAIIVDKKAKSNFSLDIKDATVKDQILYLSLNSGALSDAVSTTYLNNLLLNCKKGIDTDLFELNQVIGDCITYGRISLGEINNSKPDEKGISIKNISLNSSNGAAVASAEVKFVGITARVAISGNVTLDNVKKQLNITVTDTKLPFGINSVKFLMYVLKKNLISKDIVIQNNTIIISL